MVIENLLINTSVLLHLLLLVRVKEFQIVNGDLPIFKSDILYHFS